MFCRYGNEIREAVPEKGARDRMRAALLRPAAPVRHLYVIGNGFDRYHGAQSHYGAFRAYLLGTVPDVVRSFDLYFGPRSLARSFDAAADWLRCLEVDPGVPVPENAWTRDHLWCDFERYLSALNREKVFDLLDAELPRWGESDDDFTYADYLAPVGEVAERIRKCTFEMKYRFHRWINTLHYEKGFRRRLLRLDPDAVFLNFNYTLFLETEYDIPEGRICYIHGNRRDRFGSLVVGHRTDPEEGFREWIHKNRNRRRYRPNLKDSRGRYFANDKLAYLACFSDDEMKGSWRDPLRFYAAGFAAEQLESYFGENYKNTAELIGRHAPFFESLCAVERITVLGHSLAEVDRPYFERIAASLSRPERVRWEFSFHTEDDRRRIGAFCRSLSVPDGHCTLSGMSQFMR